MSTITDSELNTVYNTLTTIKGVISDVQPAGQTSDMKKMVTDALGIIESKIKESKKQAAAANPVGASAASQILANIRARQTKEMFDWFRISPT